MVKPFADGSSLNLRREFKDSLGTFKKIIDKSKGTDFMKNG